ncbi:MAG: hypothetical protein QXD72_01980 [Candidatus Aenigmatarchaeota archaeon]
MSTMVSRGDYKLDGILGPTVEYKVADVGFAKVITPLKDTLDDSIVSLAEAAHENSIKVYDRYGLGSLSTYLERGLKRKAREFVRKKAQGGRYTLGSVTIPKGERPVFLEPIDPLGYSLIFTPDTSRPGVYYIDIGRINKPAGYYIPYGYGHPLEGVAVIDATKYLPHEEERQIDMIERSSREQIKFYRMFGELFEIDIRVPVDLRERIRNRLRENYCLDDLAVGVHEAIGHYEQDARGMLNPRTAALLGTIPIYDRNLVEAQNVKQTAEVIGYEVGYSNLMPFYNEFVTRTGLEPNDLLVIDPEIRAMREAQYREFIKSKMN